MDAGCGVSSLGGSGLVTRRLVSETSLTPQSQLALNLQVGAAPVFDPTAIHEFRFSFLTSSQNYVKPTMSLSSASLRPTLHQP